MKYYFYFLIAILFGGIILANNLNLKTNAQTVSSPSGSPANSVTTQQLHLSDVNWNSKSDQLRLKLNILLREHAILGSTALIGIYKGESVSRLKELLSTNSNRLGTVIGTYYGTQTQDQFLKLWEDHMNEYENYTLAKKNNNTQNMEKAKDNLNTIAEELGKLLQGDHLTSDIIAKQMQDHINLTLSVVDETAENDLTELANQMKKGYDQAGVFADTITVGIVLDHPDTFQQ